MRQGQVAEIIQAIRSAAADGFRTAEHRAILERVVKYLDLHREHLDYPSFQAQGMPLGSGFVESAVKWLIQQRLKSLPRTRSGGVGIRWSEDWFNHLLMLRLAWANDRFDALFTPSPNS